LPDSLSLPREKPALGIRESKALRAKPFAEHAVLGRKVIDRHLLPSLEEPGHQQEEELQRRGALLILHRAHPTPGNWPGKRPLAVPSARRALTKMPVPSSDQVVGPYGVVDVERGKPRAELGLVLRTLDVLDVRLRGNEGPRAREKPPSGPAGADVDAIVRAARKPRP
jgi:HTH-type transcriptional regulator/antitoxin HipB